MDSLIKLGIGKFELDWGKYLREEDYSDLFGSVELKNLSTYGYDEYSEEVVLLQKKGFSRPLKEIKKRLDILGFNSNSLESIFNETREFYYLRGYDILISYEEFYKSLVSLNLSEINTVNTECVHEAYELGEYVRRCVFKAPLLMNRFSNRDGIDISFVSDFLENLNPRIILRILSDNTENLDFNVVWFPSKDYLIDRCRITTSSNNVIMIVTEGTSDLLILKRTIDELYPEISDLFDYIDMENYPFTGNGGLQNFCIGLDRIKIQKNILVLFDNDAAGVESYQIVKEKCSDSMPFILTLPDHKDFESFYTVGPQGNSFENINGKAVSIECFLDLKSVDDVPCIRWTSYQKKIGRYQGALENKESFQKLFFKSNLTDGSYDISKLKYLIDYIISKLIDWNSHSHINVSI